jgi:hypothetical protein
VSRRGGGSWIRAGKLLMLASPSLAIRPGGVANAICYRCAFEATETHLAPG